MSVQKNLLFIVLSCFSVSCFSQLNKEGKSIYVRGVLCNGSEEFVHKNMSCYGKSFNRSFSSINVIIKTKMPMNDILMKGKLFYKYGAAYREIMGFPAIDACSLVKNAPDNKVLGMLIALIRDSMPGVIHPCPYNGIEIRNCEIKTQSLLSIFPAGDYKMSLHLLTNQKIFLSLTVLTSFKLPHDEQVSF